MFLDLFINHVDIFLSREAVRYLQILVGLKSVEGGYTDETP